MGYGRDAVIRGCRYYASTDSIFRSFEAKRWNDQSGRQLTRILKSKQRETQTPLACHFFMVVALAVVSRDGTPLYLHDFQPTTTAPPSKEEYYDDDELFGGPIITGIGCANDVNVPKDSTNLINEWPCKLKFQFILHEGYVALCTILDNNQWKVPTAMMGVGTDGSGACWVGYLCSSSIFQCYGYVTTNVFYIVIVEDTIVPDDRENQLSRDREMCMLMVWMLSHLFFSLTTI